MAKFIAGQSATKDGVTYTLKKFTSDKVKVLVETEGVEPTTIDYDKEKMKKIFAESEVTPETAAEATETTQETSGMPLAYKMKNGEICILKGQDEDGNYVYTEHTTGRTAASDQKTILDLVRKGIVTVVDVPKPAVAEAPSLTPFEGEFPAKYKMANGDVCKFVSANEDKTVAIYEQNSDGVEFEITSDDLTILINSKVVSI
jgi:hypothetical protein